MRPDSQNNLVFCATLAHEKLRNFLKGASVRSVVSDYGSEKEFVSAYVDYKEDNILPFEKEQWSRKVGGMNEFRRAMKNEAVKIWRRKAKK